MLEESELRATKERQVNNELEEELILYQKEAMEQHEKGFQKAVRQIGFFAKDLDLGLFDPFKDVKDGVLLNDEEIDAEEETTDEGQGAVEEGDDAYVQATFVFIFFFLEFGSIGLVNMTITLFFFNAQAFL